MIVLDDTLNALRSQVDKIQLKLNTTILGISQRGEFF
jgi:hypothetical protein